MVCKNGHGGVEGINHRLFSDAPAAQAQPDDAIVRAWQAGYYHAGYTNDQAYADKMAREYAGAAPQAAMQERKPLTDEQIYEMYNEPRSDAEMLEFARAIEAAHGIGADK